MPRFTVYTAKATGRAAREVSCEACSARYNYVLKRTTTSQRTTTTLFGDSRLGDDAVAAAEEHLADRLRRDIDAVPCPACGHYQRHMVPKAHGARLTQLKKRWLWAAVVAYCCWNMVGILIWTETKPATTDERQTNRIMLAAGVAVGGLSTAFGVIHFRKYLRDYRGYDPNQQPLDARLAVARRRATVVPASGDSRPLAQEP